MSDAVNTQGKGTDPPPPVGTARAWLNRGAWWWFRRMGWPGALALVLITTGLTLAWAVRPALQSQLQAEQQVQARQRAALPVNTAPINKSSQQQTREAWIDQLPAWQDRSKVLQTFLRTVKAGHLDIERIDYTTQPVAPGLVRWQASLPVTASYEQIRQVTASLLNTLPNAALDNIDLERSGDAPTLTGHLRLSFFFKERP